MKPRIVTDENDIEWDLNRWLTYPWKAPMKPTVGRIVHYRLGNRVISRIAALREQGRSINGYYASNVVPLIVTRVWPDSINGTLILDGDATLWVTSVRQGSEPDCWDWPSRED